MARRKQQINTRPGYVVYLRTSTEEAQAPQRSQDGQRRDVSDKAEQLQHTRYKRWVEIDPERAPIWRYA